MCHGIAVHSGTFTLSGVVIRNNQGTGILTGPTASHYAISGCKLQYNGVAAVLDGDNFAVTGNVLLGNKVGLKVADVKTSNNSVIANNVL